MDSERLQRLRIAHPLFQHLRRCFHEILLRRDARYARPLRMSAEHVMQQVPKLVEEGDRVRVLQQSRIIGGWVVENSKQDAPRERDALFSVYPREMRGVFVFFFPRV